MKKTRFTEEQMVLDRSAPDLTVTCYVTAAREDLLPETFAETDASLRHPQQWTTPGDGTCYSCSWESTQAPRALEASRASRSFSS